MFKLRHIGQYLLALLLLILIGLQIWTYYLGTTDVTFERLLGSKPYAQIDDLSLRRYEEKAISPHLFTITTSDEEAVIEQLSKACGLKRITAKALPKEAQETDAEMVDVIERSPYIYLSGTYDLAHPQEGRMCLVFRDREHLYLFINGNL
jgi:hypothetical protein